MRVLHPSEASVFMRACRREPVPHTPVWLMRQAGRYMPEYRRLRQRVSMLELCRSPDLVSETTVFAARRLGVDAAILFADLLLPVEALGLRLEYSAGEGPVITPPVRDRRAVDALPEIDTDALSYVHEGVRRTRADLPSELPLIGFAGAPFTLASYLIEGGSTRSFARTKAFMRGDEGAWHALLALLARGLAPYLRRQIEAGAQAVQIFDSWVGCLSADDYRRYARPHTEALLRNLPAGAPVIHFGTGNPELLEEMAAAGGDVIGIDWRVDLGRAWDRIGPDRAIMGNLDPTALLAPDEVLDAGARAVLEAAGGRAGHIFNLGHGILPETPVDSARRLVERVHEMSRR